MRKYFTISIILFAFICLPYYHSNSALEDPPETLEEALEWIENHMEEHAEEEAEAEVDEAIDDVATIADTFTLGLSSAVKSGWDLISRYGEDLAKAIYYEIMPWYCEVCQQMIYAESHVCFGPPEPEFIITIELDPMIYDICEVCNVVYELSDGHTCIAE